MKILGIESSCDETGASVVKDGELILSNIVASSLKEHQQYGGIIPEIASRRQLECIHTVTAAALQNAKTKLNGIDAIAVTESPGLIGSLLVGLSFARSLSFALNIPLIEVNHIEAHLYAPFLNDAKSKNRAKPGLPAVGLVVSGGHTSLYYIKNFRNIALIGQTRDDAAGETFDKVARILGLGYPGGPAIDKVARQCKKSKLRFTCAPLVDTLDFSFSGIKTSVLYHVNGTKQRSHAATAETAYAFQKSVVEVLVKKCVAAAKKHKTKTVLLGGGVAANSFLRERLFTEAQRQGLKIHFPPLPLCLDNAAMIAGLGFQLFKRKVKKN